MHYFCNKKNNILTEKKKPSNPPLLISTQYRSSPFSLIFGTIHIPWHWSCFSLHLSYSILQFPPLPQNLCAFVFSRFIGVEDLAGQDISQIWEVKLNRKANKRKSIETTNLIYHSEVGFRTDTMHLLMLSALLKNYLKWLRTKLSRYHLIKTETAVEGNWVPFNGRGKPQLSKTGAVGSVLLCAVG